MHGSSYETDLCSSSNDIIATAVVARTVNKDGVFEYLRSAGPYLLSVYTLAYVFSIVLLLLDPLFRTLSFLQCRFVRRRRDNHYCQNTEPSEGTIDTHTCPLTQREYTTRFYDPLQDAVDASTLFASGFAMDPFSQYMQPTLWTRHRFSADWYRFQLDFSSTDCIVQEWGAQEKLVGVALMSQRPNTFWDDVVEASRTLAFVWCMFVADSLVAYRMLQSALALTAKQRAVAAAMGANRVCILKYVAVEKGFQGQGIGTHLLQLLVRHWDAVELYCYLESSSVANVPLYERFGFRVFEEHRIAPDAPPLYLMIRPPSAKKKV